MADPEVVRHLGGANLLARGDVAQDPRRRRACGHLLGYGYWVVERREDGAYLGQIGFADFKRDMTPSIEGLPEMGWIFAPAPRARAMPPRPSRAALAWADEALAAAEIVAIIDPRQRRLDPDRRKSRLHRREEALYRGEPILLFRRPAC